MSFLTETEMASIAWFRPISQRAFAKYTYYLCIFIKLYIYICYITQIIYVYIVKKGIIYNSHKSSFNPDVRKTFIATWVNSFFFRSSTKVDIKAILKPNRRPLLRAFSRFENFSTVCRLSRSVIQNGSWSSLGHWKINLGNFVTTPYYKDTLFIRTYYFIGAPYL